MPDGMALVDPGGSVVEFLSYEGTFTALDGPAAGKLDADQLSRECLRYMYRLLFLFYIEARPELGYAPMKSDVYRRGYSLERLRELEMVKLTTDDAVVAVRRRAIGVGLVLTRRP